MEYIETPNFDNDTLEKLNSVDQDVVMLTILSVVEKSGNYDLAVKVTSMFLDNDNEYIRGTAVESMSHIARLWKKLPIDLIDKINSIPLNEKSNWVQDKADDVADDLEVFIKGYERPSKLNTTPNTR